MLGLAGAREGFCEGTCARPILYAEGSMATGYVEQREGGITLSGPGFPLTPWYMPSCGVSRLKASSNRSRPSAWSRYSGPSHFTLRTGRASTRTCGMEESRSHVCETKLGVSIQRSTDRKSHV